MCFSVSSITNRPRPSRRGYALLNLTVRACDVLAPKLEHFLRATSILDTKYDAPMDDTPKIPNEWPDDIPNPGSDLLGDVRYDFLWPPFGNPSNSVVAR